MPDYGTRLPPYFSGQQPVGILGKSPYGWEPQPNRSTSNTPFNDYFPSTDFVYERLDWQKFKEQLYSGGGPGGRTNMAAGIYANPPFMGAGQMLGPNGAPSWMQDRIGGVSRIVRGYIRRQTLDPTNPESFVRLYFMYNPDEVQREYQSWADQQQLDPNNEMGIDSNQAPASLPSITTIRFTLYFDRQIEINAIKDHPGVMVDLQTFDVLSGNLIYTDTSATDRVVPVLPPGMTLPSNTGLTSDRTGQVQPRATGVTLTAVFSPSLAVEGFLSGAGVRFTKFSTRMTPMAMALTLTLTVTFVGKNNEQAVNAPVGTTTNPQIFNPKDPGFKAPTDQASRDLATKSGSEQAVAYAEANLMDVADQNNHKTAVHYDPNDPGRSHNPPCFKDPPYFTDSASFVWSGLHAINWDEPLGLSTTCGSASDNQGFYDAIKRLGSTDLNNTGRRWLLILESKHINADEGVAAVKRLRKGDILVGKPGDKPGQVAFFYGSTGQLDTNHWDDKSVIQLLKSTGLTDKGSEPGKIQGGAITNTSMNDIYNTYDLWARPEPWGPTLDFSPIAGTATDKSYGEENTTKWSPASTVAAGLQPGLTKMKLAVSAKFGLDSSGGYSARCVHVPPHDMAVGTGPKCPYGDTMSQHATGLAFDCMTTDSDLHKQIIDWCLGPAGNQYGIHEIISGYSPLGRSGRWQDGNWKPYTGANPHTNHVHLSITVAAGAIP